MAMFDRRLRSSCACSSPTVAPAPVQRLAERGAGRPLPAPVRVTMEERFGHDLSRIRVHDDRLAAEATRSVGAVAYTLGRDVAFAPGTFRPDTPAGMRLLTHELAHAVQQDGASATGAAPVVGPRDDALEREADRAADSVSPIGSELGRAPAPVLQRAPYRSPEEPFGPEEGLHRRRFGMGPRRVGEPLSYREAVELLECMRIRGDAGATLCRHEVLGEPLPLPTEQQVPGITTPQPYGVQPDAAGSTRFQINGVQIVFLRDATSTDPGMNNRAETTYDIGRYAINYRARGGVVTSFTGPGSATITIQTTYGTGVSSASASGYGRGTTADDRQAGRTTLGFHEGQHGRDFMQFVRDNQFPVFTGSVGQTVADFTAAMTTYATARTSYSQQLGDFSTRRTDCVGTTIDQYNAARGLITTKCTIRVP